MNFPLTLFLLRRQNATITICQALPIPVLADDGRRSCRPGRGRSHRPAV